MGKFHKPQNQPVTIKQTEKGLPKLYCKTQRNLESPLFQAFFSTYVPEKAFSVCIKDSVFIEPACGDGNFLVEILSRKLAVVKKKYKKFPADYEKYSVLAISTLYGVDILQDNCEACRERLYAIWDREYKAVCKREVNEDCRRSVRFILSRNIVCGNALSMMCVDDGQKDTEEPIIFSEWAFVTGYLLQRSDYTFARLMQGDDEARDLFGKKKRKKREEQMTLFNADEPTEKPSDEGEFLKKYVTHYRRVWEDEQ